MKCIAMMTENTIMLYMRFRTMYDYKHSWW